MALGAMLTTAVASMAQADDTPPDEEVVTLVEPAEESVVPVEEPAALIEPAEDSVAPIEEPMTLIEPNDTEKPVVSLAGAPSIFNSANVDFVINGTDNAALVKIVGNIRNSAGTLVLPSQTATSGTDGSLVINLDSLGDGSYNLRYNALDAAGNVANTQSFDFVVDNTAPDITVKPESIGSDGGAYQIISYEPRSIELDGVYRTISFKLHDAGKVDKVVLNGTVKDLTNSAWSDLNGVTTGKFGAIEGVNTLEVYDVAGNKLVATFTLDTTGPTATVKPEMTSGGEVEGFYRSVSYKLFDASKVVKATLNGVEKPLTPNKWSDLNGITPGVFGAVEGENTLILEDALGNQSTYSFVIDTIAPVVTTPSPEWVSGEHTWTITQTEANPHKAYVEIQQLVDGKWKKFNGVWIMDTNDLSATFDTIGLTDNVQTQIKISTWDKAGNKSGASFAVMIDNSAPTITVKPESIGSDGVFSNASFKLFDELSGVDKVFVNGVEKDLTNNKWSDLNFLKPGSFGAVEGENTIVLQDVAGNTTELVITLDSIAPTVVDEVHEWQTKDGGRDSITLTFSEPVFNMPQGWYGSGTTWTKAFYNTKPYAMAFTDQAGNNGSYTLTPNAAPVVVEPVPDPDPEVTETPSEEPGQPEESANAEEPSNQDEPAAEEVSKNIQQTNDTKDESLASTGYSPMTTLSWAGFLSLLGTVMFKLRRS